MKWREWVTLLIFIAWLGLVVGKDDAFTIVTTFFPSGKMKEHVMAAQLNVNNTLIEGTA